jgi:hypothetical protein
MLRDGGLMLMPSSMRHWLRLPSRIAMLLGLGAFSVASAKAGAVDIPHLGHGGAPIPQQSAKSLGDLQIWREHGRILVSEAGGPAKELQLGDTPEANALRKLLEEKSATAATPQVLRDRIILVGSGGAGLHWDSQRLDGSNKASAPPPRKADRPVSDTARTDTRLSIPDQAPSSVAPDSK